MGVFYDALKDIRANTSQTKCKPMVQLNYQLK